MTQPNNASDLTQAADQFIAAVELWIRQENLASNKVFKEKRLEVQVLYKQLVSRWTDLKSPALKLLNFASSTLDEFFNEELTYQRAAGGIRRALAEFKETCNRLVRDQPDLGRPATEDDYDAEARQLLHDSKPMENKLRAAILAKGLAFGLAPIIPMTSFNRDKLTRIGIKNGQLRSYTVLTSQRVLGISQDYVQNTISRALESGADEDLSKSIRRQKTFDSRDAKLTEAGDREFENTVQVFLSKNPNFVSVGEPAAWNGARWYWMMTKRELALLRSAAFNDNSFKLSKWNFAFQNRLQK